MAGLPKDRLTPAPPFTYVGVDYFGPVITKQGRKVHKRYGAPFTCLMNRAVHIEIANSLETDGFLNAPRRFIARPGPVLEMLCDNGTKFIGAERELREALREMNHDELTAKLRKQQIDWKFNPPTARHMGEVWERQKRTVPALTSGRRHSTLNKRTPLNKSIVSIVFLVLLTFCVLLLYVSQLCLLHEVRATVRRILATLLHEHTGRLDDETLHTLLCEVEFTINSRPLTVIYSDFKGPLPLSLSQILTMKTSVVLPPPGQFQRNDVYMRRRCNLFWSRWKKEYLPTLQQRPQMESAKTEYGSPRCCPDQR